MNEEAESSSNQQDQLDPTLNMAGAGFAPEVSLKLQLRGLSEVVVERTVGTLLRAFMNWRVVTLNERLWPKD